VTNDGHAALVSSLESHINTLRADNDALRQDLTTARVDLAAETAGTEKAIEAFAALADRLDQLAAERARPWWRRLVG
jgi:hypothetical protein